MSKAEEVLAYLKVKLADTEVSKETYDIYVEKFSNMSDKAITEYITKYGVRLYVDDKTINQKSIDKLVDNLKIIKEEKLNLNFIQPKIPKLIDRKQYEKQISLWLGFESFI